MFELPTIEVAPDPIVLGNDPSEATSKPFRPSKIQASYIWWLGYKHGLIGKTAPSTSRGEGSRERVSYDCLVPDSVAVQEINSAIAWAMPAISAETWKGICKRYRHEPSPYQPPIEYPTASA